MEKLPNKISGISVSVSRRSAMWLNNLRHSVEAEGEPSLSVADVLDALIEAQQRSPQRLVIHRTWTLKKALAQIGKRQPDLVSGILDSDKLKQLHKILIARAEETEEAIKAEEAAPPVEASELLPVKRRRTKSVNGDLGGTHPGTSEKSYRAETTTEKLQNSETNQ